MSWEQVPIGNLTTKCKMWSPAKEWDGLFNYIDLSSVDKEKKYISTIEKMPALEAPSRAKQLVENGDVLVSTVRPNLNGIAKVNAEHDGMTASTGYCVLRPNKKLLLSDYLFQWVKTPAFIQKMVNASSGANYPAVSDAKVKNSKIPLPPLAEQKRIAQILYKADALRAKRREALAQLDTLLQSTFLELFGDPAQNSMNLPTIKLDAVGNWKSGGTPPRGRKEYFSGKIPWFSSGELNQMYLFKSIENISEIALRDTSAKLVPHGSLMLGMYDTAALKASIAGVNCSCNQAIAFAEISSDVANRIYVFHAITIGREHFRRLQRGVRQKNLNLSMIRDIRIPLPPLDLQHRFAAIVEQVEAQKTRMRAQLAELDTLFAALQQRAFAGEL